MTAGRFERALGFLAALLAAGLFLILAWPALHGRIYTFNDLGWTHIPKRLFYWRALGRGDDFLWMPSLHCGYYLHGEGEAGMYHPWHLFLYPQ